MRSTDLRIGHLYAVPVSPGPWCRHAMPARVMTRGPGSRVLVLLPDGLPEAGERDALPCGTLVWVDADDLACDWQDWPSRMRSGMPVAADRRVEPPDVVLLAANMPPARIATRGTTRDQRVGRRVRKAIRAG